MASGGGTVIKAKVAANGVPEFDAEANALFARRMQRLEQVSVQLRHMYREHAQCLVAEKQHKADVYLHSDARSHGEREGQASAMSIALSTETLLLMGQIKVLEEESEFLKFCIVHDGGA